MIFLGEETDNWYLCPDLDYPPNSIGLGFIIDSAMKPANALNRNNPHNPVNVTSSSQSGYDITRDKVSGPGLVPEWTSHFPPFEKLLRTKGFGCEILMREYKDDHLRFDSIETETFKPDQSYLQRVVGDDNVQAFLDGSNYRKALYIVTGLKIVRGARSSSHPSDAISEWPGYRTTIAPGITVATDWRHSGSFETPLDMVFAFKMEKLKIDPEDRNVGLEDAFVADLHNVQVEDAYDGDTEHRLSTTVWFSGENIMRGFLPL